MRFINSVRHASYTVEVYLIRNHPKLGNPGTVVEVEPAYARNVLVPKGYALMMGEGSYRKVLPEMNKQTRVSERAITPKYIQSELRLLLQSNAPTAQQFLDQHVALVQQNQSGKVVQSNADKL
ncbi:hypothetical protein MP228_002869 [Amoeboaphelidium protococcarum]|nr:hypothetical protein MP228_002869 [Amoeboaphelidium protococcarum]